MNKILTKHLGNMDQLARSRVLSARGLDVLMADMTEAQTQMVEAPDDKAMDKAVRRYGRLEDEFSARGGYEAESEAARIWRKPASRSWRAARLSERCRSAWVA